MKRENYLHFWKDEDESAYMPASSFLGVDADTDTGTIEIHFRDIDGTDSTWKVKVGFPPGEHVEACKALAGALAGDKLVVTVADKGAGVYLHPFNNIWSVS